MPLLGPGGASEAAVVVTLAFTFCELVPSSVMELGETRQVASDGAPEQVSKTGWLKPPSGVSVREALAVPPVVTVRLGEEPEATLSRKSIPEPESETVCGLPLALSEIERAPVRVPTAAGVNVMSIPQEALAASVPGQLFVSAKSPVVVMPEIVRLALPEFVSVTVRGGLVVFTVWLANPIALALSTTAGAAAVPVPDRPTV